MHTRTRQMVATLAIAGALFAAACGGDDSNGASGGGSGGGEVASGEEIYASSCASCHAPDGTGLPNLGLDLTDSKFNKGLSDDELAEFITQGRGPDDPDSSTGIAMPPKGGNPALTDEDIEAVVAYLRTLEK